MLIFICLVWKIPALVVTTTTPLLFLLLLLQPFASAGRQSKAGTNSIPPLLFLFFFFLRIPPLQLYIYLRETLSRLFTRTQLEFDCLSVCTHSRIVFSFLNIIERRILYHVTTKLYSPQLDSSVRGGGGGTLNLFVFFCPSRRDAKAFGRSHMNALPMCPTCSHTYFYFSLVFFSFFICL